MADRKGVLVVDDEPYVLRSLSFVLRRAGYEVLECRDGGEAMAVIEKERPGLVFLDIMMPGVDGYQVCRAIKGSPELSSTYVIMLTAKGQEEDEEEAAAAGADEYMTKPFSPSRALGRVQTVLGGVEQS